MPVTVSYPGVYIQEEASGARAISGVATSVAMFVGMAERGRMRSPVRVFTIADFEREFGAVTSGELADQVRQFYLNGGGEAWVCRIANGDAAASVTLQAQDAATAALTVTARDPGVLGDTIRVEIDYDTAQPEQTFNLTVFRSLLQPDGTRLRDAQEKYLALSMDPAAGNFVESMINGASALITVAAAAAPAGEGVSVGGLILPATEASVAPALDAIVTATARSLRVAIGSHPPVTVPLTRMGDIANNDQVANIAAAWQADINGALTSNAIPAAVTVAISDAGFTATPGGGVDGGRLLRISSADGPVAITSASSGDAALGLMLGAANGGLESSPFGDARPAPTGVVARTGTAADGFQALRSFAGADRATLTSFNLVDDSPDTPHSGPVALGAGRMYEVGATRSLANLRGVLDSLAAAIGGGSSGRWTVRRHGFRLALTPRYGNDNTGPAAVLTTAGGYDIGAAGQPFDPAATPANVADFTVGMPGGIAGPGPFQAGATGGSNGIAPLAADYAAAYTVIDREVPLFNLLVLPRAEGQSDDARTALWGAASAFCATKRAFLIVDPRSDWTDIAAAEAGADAIRLGVETRNAAAYWPRLRIANGSAAGRRVDPAGSIAGVMARTDGNRGVWKAPAGLEATVRGVIGVERLMTDPENGVINPKALNAIRVFPSGVVVWGARTLVGFDGSGNIDDKYIPVRRTMLFIEESLYRGLRFAVFEPNDEPLWAQIRLAAGSFMNGLFRQGAFAGAKASDAYFVKCDATTTTPNDINLGIVNVIVGFAPLKPAEFVIITVKQIAGQVAI